MRCERAVKSDLPGRVNSVHLPEMHLIRRHQANSGMVVILVVPIEERRRQQHYGVRQDAPSLDVSDMPSKAATFLNIDDRIGASQTLGEEGVGTL
jgi:hypothetical protein